MKSAIKASLIVAAAMITASASMPGAQAQSNGAAPSDPQIVGIVVAANQIDIDYGKLALSKSKDQAVRSFAQQMITDHSSLQKAVGDLGAKLKVTPASSDTSKALNKQAKETTSKLKKLSGSAFDKAYVANEIAFHKAVINANDNVLIPSAKNGELKSALEGARPLFQGHLEHVENIQSTLH
jgi:putative membrane protein